MVKSYDNQEVKIVDQAEDCLDVDMSHQVKDSQPGLN